MFVDDVVEAEAEAAFVIEDRSEQLESEMMRGVEDSEETETNINIPTGAIK